MHWSRSLLLLVLLLPVGCGMPMFRARTSVTQTVVHVSGTPVRVESSNGSIQVIADPTLSEVHISARITCSGSTQAEADQRLADTRLTVARDTTGLLLIKPAFAGGMPRSGDGASIDVHLPDATGASLHTSNGHITLEGLSGDAEAYTSNGAVTVTDHDGSVRLATSNGAVRVEHVNGSLDADTSNGSVRVGDLGGKATIDTSNGPISISLRPDQPGPLTLRTSNAPIDVEVGPAFQGTVTCDTSNAAIRVKDEAGRVTDDQREKSWRRFVVGTGGEASALDTSNARIEFAIESGT